MSKEKQPIDATEFKTIIRGTLYELPVYKVTSFGLELREWIRIQFVRGSTDPEDDVNIYPGILPEGLLAMQIEDIRYKNELVPCRENALAITKLEEALHWLQARQKRRREEGTQGTYKQTIKPISRDIIQTLKFAACCIKEALDGQGDKGAWQDCLDELEELNLLITEIWPP